LSLGTKFGWVAATVASVVLAGSVATVSAQHSFTPASHTDNGYTKDQCKDGGWKNFKNPDGSQQFKNQGQSIKFFKGNDKSEGDQDGDSDGHDNQHHQFFGDFSQLFQAFEHWWASFR